MNIFLSLFLFISFAVHADTTSGVSTQTKTPEDDQAKIVEYNQACQVINALLVRKQFPVTCNSNYQYFGPTSIPAKNNGPLRIAGYNLLHPGTSKALFKDYNLVAKIINQYDAVSTLELLGTVGHDEVNNQAVLALLRGSPKMMSDLKDLKTKTKDAAKIKDLDAKIAKLAADTLSAYNLYRSPGYFKVLMALKKYDPSWSLILSPRGDSALQGSVEEMVGFFFRASTVTPAVNPHCNEFKDENAGTPYACIINLGAKFMDKDYNHNYARRPFMASFKSGNMKFTMVSWHVVFTFSGDEEAAKKLLQDTFGVDTPAEVGPGVNAATFARFAEVKTTLNFMDRYRKKYNDNTILMVSDTNLTAQNAYWPEVLKNFTGASVLIDEPTTISPPRYSGDGKETNGVANSYDHFVLDKSAFPGCNSGEVFNYYKSQISADIQRTYGLRENEVSGGLSLKTLVVPFDENGVGDIPPEDDQTPTKLDYPMTAAAQTKIDRQVGVYSTQLKSMFTVKQNQVVADDFLVPERIDGYKRRIYLNQLTNAFYYRFYQELLSDHFPVSITCRN